MNWKNLTQKWKKNYKNEIGELILLCTKEAHFTFSGQTFTKIDSVAMGSQLPPILSGIFMVELESNLIPTLKDHLSCWRRYADVDIHLFKMDWLNICCQHLITSIKFTSKTESDNKLSFLDVQLIHTGYNIESLVYLENQLTQTFTFTGTRLHHFNGNTVHIF